MASAVQLLHPALIYTQYVQARLATLRGQLGRLDIALRHRDVGVAERDWVSAHETWLAIGQDDAAYGAFGDLGEEIDGLAAGDVGGTASPKFTGFHRIELELFRRHDIGPAAHAAAKLTVLVDSITPKLLRADLPLNPTALSAWVLRPHEILEDALRDSLSQNDNYGSDSDLASLSADVSATREVLNVLARPIALRYPGLVPRARRQLTAITQVLSAARRYGDVEPVGLPLRVRQRIDAGVDAALETLAPISEILQVPGTVS